MIKRCGDFVVSALGLAILLVPMLLIGFAVRLDSPGPALHWSQRYGARSRLFAMPKFRTMRTGTPQLATHLMREGDAHVTRLGRILRRTSLDELPQLWSVLIGQMSLVGPRPALFNQDDLMTMRRRAGIDRLRPGITGWAQINGRDELPLPQKVRLEMEYLDRHGFVFDLRILALTLLRGGKGVTH